MDIVTPTKVEIAVSGIEVTALKKLSLVAHALASKMPRGAREEASCLAGVLDDVIRRIELAAAATESASAGPSFPAGSPEASRKGPAT